MPPKKSGASTVVSSGSFRDERAAAFREKFNKQYKGRAQLKSASEYVLPFLTKRLMTGLLSLDLELKGGFPAGGLSQIVGPKNSGKSYLTWQVIRQLQYYLGDKMKVLLAMTEMRADRSQARKAGVQISLGDDDIKSIQKARAEAGWEPLTKEQVAELKTEIGEIDELHAMSGEELYDGILSAVEQNIYHLIVIDSFGSIMSAAEAEAESVSDKTYGGSSGVTTQFLRKLTAFLTMDNEDGVPRDVCIIGINQIRDNLKDPNKEYKSPGGRMLEHCKFVDLYVSSGKALGAEVPLMTPDGTKQRFQQWGKEVHWRIEKGKAGIHEGARGSYNYSFNVNAADFYMDTFVAGVRSGVIEASGAWIGIPNPEDPDKYLVRVQGRDAFCKMLAQDAIEKAAKNDPNSFMNLIRAMAFKKTEINISYDWGD